MTWLYTPSKSVPEWACLEKDCELGSNTWASRIAPCATLSGKHTQPQSWQRAWKKAPWMERLSGLTYSPSTVQRGVEQWIASLQDSRAKTSALQGDALGLMAPGPACSSTSATLPTLAVRDTSFWRTSQASLLPPPPLWTKPKELSKSARPPESWENWPTAGGMRSGSLFQRPTWAPAMGGRGGSAGLGAMWDTPDGMPEAPNTGSNRKSQVAGLGNQAQLVSMGRWATPDCNTSTYSNGKMGPNIREQTAQWATPQARDSRSPDSAESGNYQRKLEHGYTIDLNSQAFNWPTPRGTDGTKGGPNQAVSNGDLMLPSAAAQWPTPNAHVIEAKAKPPIIGNRKPSDPQIGLADIAVRWPTPAARDYRSESGGGKLCDQPTERIPGPDAELHGCPFFAPGPNDARWPAIIAAEPWLTPALSISGEEDAKAAFQAAQSIFRGTADGLAPGLDFSNRAPRLKCVGNGVVALQSAAAAVVLIRRAGIGVIT